MDQECSLSKLLFAVNTLNLHNLGSLLLVLLSLLIPPPSVLNNGADVLCTGNVLSRFCLPLNLTSFSFLNSMTLGNPLTYYASEKGIQKRILTSKSFTEFFISDLKVNLSFKKWTLSSKLNKIKGDFAERGKERL
uniref:Uncharacterized protein n=1 Tax=Populus davidiana TaxID=266767 RepID=A0A6M2F8W5_9ROSI